MARKIKPIEEGSLAALARYFAPLVACRPEGISATDWLEHVIFHVHERVIKTFIVLETFTMPGLYYWLPTTVIQGYGRRRISPGTELVVRVDSTTPWMVDVETITKVREKPRVFRLSPEEWKKISLHVKEMEPCE